MGSHLLNGRIFWSSIIIDVNAKNNVLKQKAWKNLSNELIKRGNLLELTFILNAIVMAS